MPDTTLAIVFDLDGTLVDTAPDLLAALNAVLTVEGHDPVLPQDLRHLVGHGARAMFEHALLRTESPVPAPRLSALTEKFLAYYRANIARGSKPFPGVPETLVRLAGQGAGLGVCTNKAQDLTELLLDELQLTHHFPAIVGGGRTPYTKPDPRHLLAVVTALKGRSDRAVLVGDSPVDVAAARAAGIPVIAMSYGYTPVPVHELGADAVLDDFAELPSVISRLVS
ncbi:MAG TPA: phosphoglycolate phosphatase [Micropepsaceae bacterium]|jgi:phosphoglycolate phosphatase|nr:phosphoglycolate phosphatase [Micropepsaceae bacterium]